MLNREHLLIDRIVASIETADKLIKAGEDNRLFDNVSIPKFLLKLNVPSGLDVPSGVVEEVFTKSQSSDSVFEFTVYENGVRWLQGVFLSYGVTSNQFALSYIHPGKANVVTKESLEYLVDTLFCTYVGIQFYSSHRPEMFTYGEKQVVVPKTFKKNGRYKTVNETKMVRVIHLDSEELSKRHHNITCPSWGVAGHYRHYKDGKVVFIKSYRKGKKRDDPEAFRPKDYTI